MEILTDIEKKVLKLLNGRGHISSSNNYEGFGIQVINNLVNWKLIHQTNTNHRSAYVRYELTKKGEELSNDYVDLPIEEQAVAKEESPLEVEVEESEESRKKRAKINVDKEIKRLDEETEARAEAERKQIENQNKTKKKKDV